MNPSQRDAFNKACAWQGWAPTFRGYRVGDHSKLFVTKTQRKNILAYMPLHVAPEYVLYFGCLSGGDDLQNNTFKIPVKSTSSEVFILVSKALALVEAEVLKSFESDLT